MMAAQSLSDGNSALTLNGVALGSAVADLPEGAVLANGGGAPITITLTATGQPVTAPAAGGKGYTLLREYFTMEGAPVDPAQVSLGTRLVTVLTVRPDSAEGDA
ncbi:hypothetical protein QWZ10_15280 [Paracoccus cavernae]|uniref:Head decoration protein n=1 Tax=Paracoccus cavernae TaxID=1571207 RepID=A0ABT8D8Y8_9RHOB|nr:hypothetical protein [Paracoccus cavernae]